jgi:uncharacterized protein (DUF488 family)
MYKKVNDFPKYYRQKFLLGLLQRFGYSLNKTDFIKYLFLLENEENINRNYFFLPYKYGPFSFHAYADLHRLDGLSFIRFNKKIDLINKKIDYLSLLKDNDIIAIDNIYRKYSKLKGKKLIENIYKRYPYFTLKSEIACGKDNIKLEKSPCFFTIGYEGKTIDEYLNQIIKENIYLIIDVRKNPVSMKYGFSKKFLFKTLPESNIQYIHMPELGIETEKRKNLNSIEDYKKLFIEYEKEISNRPVLIEKIIKLYQNKKRIGLTCFEKEYIHCHRSIISKKIEYNYGIKVSHI